MSILPLNELEKAMKHLPPFLVLACLACGMTAPAPSSDGKLGSNVLITQTAINTTESNFLPAEEIGVVVADVLNIRPCPQDSEACPPLGYLLKGDAVMGTCYTFADGSVWLGFDHVDGEPTRWVAVIYQEARFVDGVCNE